MLTDLFRNLFLVRRERKEKFLFSLHAILKHAVANYSVEEKEQDHGTRGRNENTPFPIHDTDFPR